MNPHWSIQILTPPVAEPVSLLEASAWVRADGDDENEKLSALISAAREYCEAETGRAMMPTAFRLTLDRFPLIPNSQYSPGNPNAVTPVLNNTWPLDPSSWAIFFPRSPVISIDSVKYYDGTGTLQTMDPSGYLLDASSEPARIAPSTGGYWPGAQFRPNAVQVNFTAGYVDPASVPAGLKLAMKFLFGSWFDNPNANGLDLKSQPMAAQTLLAQNRVPWVW